MIAQRDKDIADLLAILLLRPDSLNPPQFWQAAEKSGLITKLPKRLAELVERISSGETMSIWFERTRTVLSDDEIQLALQQLYRLQKRKKY